MVRFFYVQKKTPKGAFRRLEPRSFNINLSVFSHAFPIPLFSI
ncbi:hypothetical protein bthur0013_8950 [Bacillus thuringiensis IBL 200]|nr:hypothetical protein bthur0013_8950 [Bacillus thuringiensis IBL 200]